MTIPGQSSEQKNKLNMKFLNLNNNKLAISVFVLLILITVLTNYYGSTDIYDYANTAKFFAGKYPADIRNSHSFLYGFLNTLGVSLLNNFFIFKIMSLLWLALIIYSVYIVSGKNKKTFWLMLLSPIVWYMAPWINPIQLASLFLLWAYYFMKKYDETDNLRFLAYSGVLIGLGWAFWDTILYFGVILGACYLFNKKFYSVIVLFIFVMIGLSPRLILDHYLFNFAFLTTIKTFISGFVNLLFKGISGESGHTPKNFFTIFSIVLAMPLYFWSLYKPKFLKANKKIMIFISLSFLLILSNPQIRYTLAIIPIIITVLGDILNEIQFKRQIIFSILVILCFIVPYEIQVSYSVNNQPAYADFTYMLENTFSLNLSKAIPEQLIAQDLNKISIEYPDKVFVVGNAPDDYAYIASIYWGKDIKEFVSIQDYDMWKNNETVLFEKTFMPIPNIDDRRQIWVAGGINRNVNDKTNFSSINYGIGVNEPLNLTGFELVKKYDALYLYKK